MLTYRQWFAFSKKKKDDTYIYICIILSKSLERTFASSIYLSRNYSDGYVLNFRKLKLTDKSFHFSLLAILRRIAQTVLRFLFFSWSMEGSGVRGSSKFMSLQDSPWDMPADTMTVTPLWSRLFRYRWASSRLETASRHNSQRMIHT